MQKKIFIILNLLIVGCSTSSKIDDKQFQSDQPIISSKNSTVASTNQPISSSQVTKNSSFDQIIDKESVQVSHYIDQQSINKENSINPNLSKTVELTEIEKIVQSGLDLFPKLDVKNMNKYISITSTNHHYFYTSKSGSFYIFITLWIRPDNTVSTKNMTQGTFTKSKVSNFILKDGADTQTFNFPRGYNKIYSLNPVVNYDSSGDNWIKSSSLNRIPHSKEYIVDDHNNQLKFIKTKTSGQENGKTILILYSYNVTNNDEFMISFVKNQ